VTPSDCSCVLPQCSGPAAGLVARANEPAPRPGEHDQLHHGPPCSFASAFSLAMLSPGGLLRPARCCRWACSSARAALFPSTAAVRSLTPAKRSVISRALPLALSEAAAASVDVTGIRMFTSTGWTTTIRATQRPRGLLATHPVTVAKQRRSAPGCSRRQPERRPPDRSRKSNRPDAAYGSGTPAKSPSSRSTARKPLRNACERLLWAPPNRIGPRNDG
jgi:hypothetical protein